MKKLYLLLLCFDTDAGISQQAVVANEKQNIVYCGVPNPLSALAAGYPCASVVLTTDNGKIERRDCGRFSFIPMETGAIIIKVWVKRGKVLKKIDEIPYSVKQLPLPVALLGPLSLTGPHFKGPISISALIGSRGVRAHWIDFDYDVSFQVISYSVSATRDSKNLFTINNDGARYTDEVITLFLSLETNDHLCISNIKCVGPDNKEFILVPLEFTVTE